MLTAMSLWDIPTCYHFQGVRYGRFVESCWRLWQKVQVSATHWTKRSLPVGAPRSLFWMNDVDSVTKVSEATIGILWLLCFKSRQKTLNISLEQHQRIPCTVAAISGWLKKRQICTAHLLHPYVLFMCSRRPAALPANQMVNDLKIS